MQTSIIEILIVDGFQSYLEMQING